VSEVTTQDRTFQILGGQLGDAAVRAAASQAYIESLEKMIAERDDRIRYLEGEISGMVIASREEAAGSTNSS
jgi:hypothetical protein